MKAFVLTTLIAGLISVSCFAQVKHSFKINLSDVALNANSNGINPEEFASRYQVMKSLTFNDFLPTPELGVAKQFESNNDQVTIENNVVKDRMPCYKPEIKSLMPIHEPDSTTKYTLLIKSK